MYLKQIFFNYSYLFCVYSLPYGIDCEKIVSMQMGNLLQKVGSCVTPDLLQTNIYPFPTSRKSENIFAVNLKDFS